MFRIARDSLESGLLNKGVLKRGTYKKNKLSHDRIDRLISIGFNWELKGPTLPWEARFNELLQYKAKHGDCDVPKRGGKLGEWASKQRVAYKSDSLPQDRINRLNSIGFNWAVITGRKGDWEYKAKHGDCNVSTKQGNF